MEFFNNSNYNFCISSHIFVKYFLNLNASSSRQISQGMSLNRVFEKLILDLFVLD
ncbi:hypothetical protein LEP1GSC126_0819 [Leptospira kirschneri str. 200801774]|nr:hypothetical protein LEP1GSC126_0819 [Leptospira kirschneri str. 200801774]